ncbi:hypothetical protein Lepto7376_2560 [[Leptolyngbya] sp. PCC 7376]|uniref:CHAT domain-containing protein n=1 Tax=[Leptolyngbya] sp. PCC 7376 TaxID=111781 RepID=UPI00029EDB96|nr:CHAT domain-containing protein [[Leptolyngbya] sp. PCC 7376]AFY38833.1 hypothetical protein Lepto7376_2560 [[Leptolyngbya] sp. PCC 7376]
MLKSLNKLLLTSSLAITLGFSAVMPSTAQTLDEKIVKMEQGLEKEFETYFDSDLATTNQLPEEMAKTLARMGEATNTTPAVLWAMPREDHLHLVLITPNGEPIARNLYDLPKTKVREIANQFTRSITNPRRPFNQRIAKELHQALIEPFELEFLQPTGIDTLLVCMGDGLRSLPLAALHDGDHFLIEKYAVTRIPAFNLINHEYSDIQRGGILAMGASEFEELKPLPAVPIELETIVEQLRSIKPAKEEWHELSLLNQDFTQTDLQALLTHRAFDIVHLATHAEFMPGSSSQSYIQFHDRKLTLEEMPKFDWNQADVDLLVLSACRTAVGDSEAELGFAGLALQLGVDSAIASLWNVNDAGTLALMGDFYQELSVQNTKAEALRQAQLKMLRGKIQFEGDRLLLSRGSVVPIPDDLSSQIPPTKDLSHPYYWAAFSMISSPW